MTVRRIKSYSAQTGYVYQYYFDEVRAEQRRAGQEGTEYVYVVSRDRKHTFLVPVFLRRQALEEWAKRHGRRLNGTEEYAAAKMRLFAAFDGLPELEAKRLTIEVTSENLEELLAQLDID
ncbi:MAG: hypothetical protein HY656_07455 [Acidobacteria bacterium]|nr:hypothetical protein [Acidobacteriota bacterium]